jgi:hypothetical protein
MSTLRFAACVAGLTAACGGSGPKPSVVTAPTVPAREPASAPVQAALTVVPPPPELFAVARISSASKALDTAIGWSGLPLDWRAKLAQDTHGLDRVAALSAPVDFAAMLDPASGDAPRVIWAFAVGVSSVDAALAYFRQEGFRVSPDSAGSHHVQIGSDLGCVLGPALGAAPARVVCSDTTASADALAPYLTRGLPTEAAGPSEIHAHAMAEPFRHRYASQLALVRTIGVPFLLREAELDHPKFDRALRDVLYGLADEIVGLAYDLDRIDVDIALTPSNDAFDVSTSLSLSGQRSWWGQTMARSVGRGGAAPEPFWKLPGDSAAAGYSAYSDPDRMRGIAVAMGQLLDGWLDYEQLPDNRRAPLVEAFEQALTTGARSANATLVVEPAVGQARSGEPEQISATVRGAVGSHLFVLDGGGESLGRLASEVVKAMGDGAFRGRLAKSKLFDKDQMPKARERAPRAKGLPAATRVYELEIPAAAFLPPHGEAVAMAGAKKKAPSASKKAGAPLTIVLIAMPDGPLTWFALGTDEKMLAGRLAAVRGGTGTTLAGREGLAPLRAESQLSAGFSSLGGMLAGIGSPFGGEKQLGDSKSMARLPHRGESPLLWHVGSDGHGPRVTASVRITKTLVEDIVALTASQLPGR